jgi:hypothetical protein
MICTKSTICLENHFGCTRWNLVSVRLEIVLILMQDNCTFCVERTTGSEIFLDTLDGTPRCVGHEESHFVLFGETVSVGAR